jgi:5'-nucleotidase
LFHKGEQSSEHRAGVLVVVAALVATLVLVFLSGVASAEPKKDRGPSDQAEKRAKTVDIQVLSTNDFHGNLNPRTLSGSPVGGAAYLAAYLERERKTDPKGTLMLDAGDLIGASPFVSAYFDDRPTIEAANEIGYDNVTLGNHEFDAGREVLEEQVGWTEFPYWSANVVDEATGEPFLRPKQPPYEIFKRKGVKVGVVNLTTETTPSIVNPSGIEGLEFASAVEKANAAVEHLQRRKVETIILLAHMGTDTCFIDRGCRGDDLQTDPDDIGKNEAARLAREVSDEVDLIIGGHTHQGVDTVVDGKQVVEAYSYGTAYADTTLTISRASKDVVDTEAEIVTTWHENRDGTPAIQPDPKVQKIVDEANEEVAPIVKEVVGYTDVPLTRASDAESNLGNVVTDAMNRRADELEGDVDFAFTNSGGIRSDIDQGDVTRGQVFETLPFQNVLTTVTLTGEQVVQILETGVSGRHGIVQVSGLRFTYDPAAPVGERVRSVTVAETGEQLDPDATYRVVTNDFMYNGGDDYTTFQKGADPVFYSGVLLSDALVSYLRAESPITQGVEGRISTSP